VITLGLIALTSAPYLEKVTGLPRESVEDVAASIKTRAPPSAPVFAYVPYPFDLEFFLGRPVERPRTSPELSRVCEAAREVVFVSQPWLLPTVTVPCTKREGARYLRFAQYARGEEVNVWLIPPSR